MVITRAQSKNIDVGRPIEYRGFYIKDCHYEKAVDQFYNKVESGLKGDKNDTPLYHFWATCCPKTQIQLPKDMSLGDRENLLKSLIKNRPMWRKFHRYCKKFVEPVYKHPIFITNTSYGITQFSLNIGPKAVDVNLQPLFQYRYWFDLLTALFTGILNDLLSEFKTTTGIVKRGRLTKKIIKNIIIGLQLIENPFIPDFGRLKFYSTIKQKMLELLRENGLECAFLLFARCCPQMVSHEICPIVNKKSPLYKKSTLRVSLDEPIFGRLYEEFGKYY